MSEEAQRAMNKALFEGNNELKRLYRHLARVHAEYADSVSAATFDGQNARMCAVRDAMLAGDDDYANALVTAYLEDPAAGDRLKSWFLGGHWARSTHLECQRAAAHLRDVMSRAELDDASLLAFAILTLDRASATIVRWESATAGSPPWELQEAAREAQELSEAMSNLDVNATDEELEAARRETGAAYTRLIKEAGRWVRYHSGVATEAAITARRFGRGDLQNREHIEDLQGALKAVLGAETLEEAKVVAARELAVDAELVKCAAVPE